MMPSPFPGMDPYLEAADNRPGFHHSLAVELSSELNSNLPTGYYADLGRREEVGMIEVRRRRFSPARTTARRALSPAGPEAARDATVSLPRRDASPSIRITGDCEPSQHLFVEIRDPARDHKLITLIEILSPSSRHPGPDREAYEAKQREVLQSDASLIELDLLRGGRRIVPDRHVEAMLDRLEPSPSYVVLVNRAWQRSHAPLAYRIYPTGLRELLPCIRVPLKEHEDEILLDLQHVFNRIYDAGPYRRGAVDYAGPVPAPVLDKEDAAWAAELTRPWREAAAAGS